MKKAINLRKIIEKIELVHIVIFLIVFFTILFVFYQYDSTSPKLVYITTQIENLPEEDMNINIQNANKKYKLLICKIDEQYFDEIEYRNYVLGNGTGKKVNCNILIKKDNEYYKAKTKLNILYNEKITFIACINNKYWSDDCEILLYNNENKTIYRCVGGNDEK